MSIKKTITVGVIFMATSLHSVATELPVLKVFKSPTCGCCSEWVKYLEKSGFVVESHDVKNLTIYKKEANLPAGMGSCHTAFVGEYAIEGHVPAVDIKRMLTDQPDIRGLAVPGMPMGSPGMEYGNRKDSYQTISYTNNGQLAVFANH